ncbi:MAG: hypothetical protein ACYC57_08095 [Thermoleophilia bacterium]
MLVVALMLLWAMPAYATEGGALPDETATIDQAVAATGQDQAEDAADVAAPVTADEAAAPEETGDAAADDQNEDVDGEAADESEADEEPATDEAPVGETAVTAIGDPLEEDCEDCAGDNSAALEDCEDAKKYLELICGEGAFGIFWESRADYDAGLLSIRYRLRNTSTDTTLNNIRIVSATANAGVKVDNLTPVPLGSLAPGEWMYFTLKWLVPKGVGGFVTDLSICADCQTLCVGDDCEPVCEGDDCEPVCEGDDCEPVCVGDDCEPVCEGDDCEPVCEGDDCEPVCEGDDCEPVCEGDGCEPVCEGDDCEPVCEGDGCNPALDEEQDPPVDNRVSEPLSSSTLPNTGADLSLLLALGLGLMLAGAMLPAARMARQKQR